MRISSTAEANEYYAKINSLVDEYINEWGIRPSSLKNYLKPDSKRFRQFLARNEMSSVIGADKILKDVIEDRCAIEKDGVLTFENFNFIQTDDYKMVLLSSEIFKGIENSELSHEKCIADYFDVSLSSIEIIDSKKHLFKIEDWGNDDLNVVVYDSEDLELIKSNLVNFFIESSTEHEVNIIQGLGIKLFDIINKEKTEKLIGEKLTDKIISKIISNEFGEEWSFSGKHGEFYLWVS